MKLSWAALPVLLALAVPSASAQSLGELAKKEQARRKAAPPATKTYTNDDLKAPTPSPADASAGVARDAKPGDAKPADKTAEPEKVDAAKPAEPAKDEKYWSGRIASAREDVRRNEAFREALQ